MSATNTGQLQDAINMMDGMAQDAFSEIAAISKLALVSLENPIACNDFNTISAALEAIFRKALDAENCINARAEEVGCNYVDEAHTRRWTARREADKAKV